MREVELRNGGVALVDDEDYEEISKGKWWANGKGGHLYAQRSKKVPGTQRVRTLMMHREIMKAPDGMDVDHINGNGLDNRRENLRVVAHWQNLHNAGKPSSNTTGYKGVAYFPPTDRWAAHIGIRGKQRCLGYFATKEGAARAYDAAARRMVGECAGTNFDEPAQPELELGT